MISLQANDKFAVMLTLGDRNNDGTVDLSVDATLVIPGILGGKQHVVAIPTLTENLPVDQAKSILAMAESAGIAGLSSAIPAFGALAHFGAGILHLPGK